MDTCIKAFNYRSIYTPAFEILVLIASVSSEGSDEPVLAQSLARPFASHTYTKMGVKEVKVINR